MFYTKIPSVLLTITLLIVETSRSQALTFDQLESVPEWATQAFERSGLQAQYALEAHINPFYQRADFDGDGKLDFAVLVKERSSNKIGIAFFHRGTSRVYILGAGTKAIPQSGDNFSWLDGWRVFDKGKVEQGVGEGPPPKLKGDALEVFESQSASALLWWTGNGYSWYQQGD